MVLCRHYCETSSFLTIIHYCKVVVSLVVIEETVRIFVRAQHVTFVNFITVLVEETRELTDGLMVYTEIIEHFVVIVLKNSFVPSGDVSSEPHAIFPSNVGSMHLPLNLITLIVLFL